MILKSEESVPPIIEYITSLLASSSFAIIVPAKYWFSFTVNVELDVNNGASLTLVRLTVTSWLVDNVPSLAFMVKMYEDFDS